MMLVAVVVAAVLVAITAVLAVVRAEKGPSMLDRAVALDTLTVTLVGAVAIEAIWTRRTDTIPILVALSLVGFIGSVTISRFAAVEPEGEHMITAEEVAEHARAAEESHASLDDVPADVTETPVVVDGEGTARPADAEAPGSRHGSQGFGHWRGPADGPDDERRGDQP